MDSADAADFGVYDSRTLPSSARPHRGNEGTTQETGARIAGLGAECETGRTVPPNCQWIYVGDSASDISPFWQTCEDVG
jgi:hypothetical protein